MSDATSTQADYLLTTRAIRERTEAVFNIAKSGGTSFRLELGQLDSVADFVLEVTRANYPDLNIPFHSRTGHLNAGGVSRTAQITDTMAQLELILVSVLLDAGAGDTWTYNDPLSKKVFVRSEGLAVASFNMFIKGGFSSTAEAHADAAGLMAIRTSDVVAHFQVSDQNPLIGVDGRIELLNQLGRVVDSRPDIFSQKRPGQMLEYLLKIHGPRLRASHVLDFVLRVFGPIWPSRLKLGNLNLGDVWSYPGLGPKDSSESLVPFHKLSQWLTYSLLVPIMEAGILVDGVDELTGLAEYRNGGLMLDTGLIVLRNQEQALVTHDGSQLVEHLL